MKKIFFSILMLGVALTGMAQSKLDLRSRAVLRQYQTEKMPVYNPRTKSFDVSAATPKYVGAMIKLNDGASVEELEAEGVNVIRTRGNIAMVTMPVGEVERISTLKCIKTISLSRKLSTKTDNARTSMGVDKIHSGEGLDRSYTGKGVVTGIVDAGIDANHINFRNEDGSSRIKRLSYIYANGETLTATSGYNVDLYEGDDVANFVTDDETTYHGTHTMGIMAGGYKGNLTYGKGTSKLSAEIVDGANPFYGMAPESDIVASCGDLSDMFIALGIESALDYAYMEQKPAVINLSLGSNIGAHDGKDVMCQYLDLAGEEAVICVAAGNEGLLPIALNQTLTADDTELKTFIASQYGNVSTESGIYYNLRYGQVYIYSDDDTEFSVKMVAYNRERGRIIWQHTLDGSSDGTATYYASEDKAGDGDLTNVNFSKAFSGYAGIGSMLDKNNGRYYALLDYFICDNQDTNADGKYIFGFVVEGKEGQRIDCYCDGTFSFMDGYDQDGWDDGSTNGSISDMACAENILVVGAYNTRNAFTSLDGKPYTNGTYPVGEITDFSSYGTLSDGRNLPHICAPGAQIVSSISTPYMEYVEAPESAYQARITETDGRNNYWVVEKGTSMATPAVAGSVALWLEANPYLTIDEVREIAVSTAVKDTYVTNFDGDPIRWGAGKFNAYEGLKEAIRLAAGIDEAIVDNNRLMVKAIGDDCYNVFLGNADEMNVTLCNISGQSVLNASAEGDEINIDASMLATGIYILNVNGTHSQRILVK